MFPFFRFGPDGMETRSFSPCFSFETIMPFTIVRLSPESSIVRRRCDHEELTWSRKWFYIPMPLNCLLAAASLCPCRTRQHPNSLIHSQAPLLAFNHLKLGFLLSQLQYQNPRQLFNHFPSLRTYQMQTPLKFFTSPTPFLFPPSLTEKISRSNTVTLQ